MKRLDQRNDGDGVEVNILEFSDGWEYEQGGEGGGKGKKRGNGGKVEEDGHDIIWKVKREGWQKGEEKYRVGIKDDDDKYCHIS
ncbi:hypothetical protein SESBI_00093 [Sesbania bispinosa]|nr:hypothetical protein SESBI_00093 [Sesbania bispinosa]